MPPPLTGRNRNRHQQRAGLGFPSGALDAPRNLTLRELSRSPGRRRTTVRQSVGAGMRTLISVGGTLLSHNAPLVAIIRAHLHAEAQSRGSGRFRATYSAINFDADDRPQQVLVIPNQRFGSHTRGENENHGRNARIGDHQGHGAAQASVLLPAGEAASIMTSQSAEMNTAVQLPLERAVDQLLQQGRVPIFNVNNQFSGATPDGELPRASHQHFVLLSTNSQGTDTRLHCNVNVSQR